MSLFCCVDMSQQETETFSAAYPILEHQIDSLKRTLLMLRQNRNPTTAMSRTFLLAYAAVNMATIQLNKVLANHHFQAKEKSLTAGKYITDMIGAIDLRTITFINPALCVSRL